jgi:hypothetical protein
MAYGARSVTYCFLAQILLRGTPSKSRREFQSELEKLQAPQSPEQLPTIALALTWK